MNRPFFAFGVLLALLAGAMLAVSSSSRSTTVRPPSVAVNAPEPSSRRQPGGIYVVVLPAANGELGEDSVAEVAVEETAGELDSDCRELAAAGRTLEKLISIRIEDAGADAFCGLAPIAECQAHGSNEVADELAHWQPVHFPDSLRPDEVLALFHSFVPELAPSSLRKSPAPPRIVPASFSTVRSSRWLCHFAATTWDRLSMLLRSYAGSFAAAGLVSAAADGNLPAESE